MQNSCGGDKLKELNVGSCMNKYVGCKAALVGKEALSVREEDDLHRSH
jgi:hypothetical protein